MDAENKNDTPGDTEGDIERKLDAAGHQPSDAGPRPVAPEVETAAQTPEAPVEPEPVPEPVVTEPLVKEPAVTESVAEEPVLAMSDEPPQPKVTLQLDRKHPLAIRWMHWVNFPVLFTMIWSGILIYWNDSDNAYKHPHAVYRVGIGSFTLFRLFPEWFWKALDVPYHVTQGLGYHFFFMWIFAINGIVYVLFTAISGEWRFVVPERKSLKEAIQVTLVDLHIRKGMPPQKKYNGAQRIAYTSIILMGAGSLVTGLSIYKPTQAHWLTTMLGGYEMARWEHFWLTMSFCGFFIVHIAQVILAGWNNFRSMVSGLEIKPLDEPSLEAERRSWS